MKLLVTGGCGFIGSNFVRYWNEKYPTDEIVVLDKLTYAGRLENLGNLLLSPRLAFIKGDICDRQAVTFAMEGVDVVAHFAAESHVDRSIMSGDAFIETNVFGTKVLLQEAVRRRVRLFHYVSTDEVFGSLPRNRPDLKFNEETPYAPSSPYAASKAIADMLVRTCHEVDGLPITITNTSNNYGPYQYPEKLIPLFVTNLLEDQPVPLMGRGENVRDWIHVDDHCSAIDLIVHAALEDPKVVGETFCVGGNGERTNLQVAQEIFRIMDRDESWIKWVPHRLGHDARYAIDFSKIKRVLGWEPQYDLEVWFEKTVRWYVENPGWWRPLKEGQPNIGPEAQRTQRLAREKETT